jgi:hypothetical protein
VKLLELNFSIKAHRQNSLEWHITVIKNFHSDEPQNAIAFNDRGAQLCDILFDDVTLIKCSEKKFH